MGAVVTFDPAAFIVRYPEFASVSTVLLNDYFTEATLYLANDGTGPVNDPKQQTMLLWMITAHIAQLYSGANGQGASPFVGRVTSASEGSVSVASDLGSIEPGSETWFALTKYGMSFWNATARWRQFMYRAPAVRRVFV